ncbi:hypothetical protein SO802_022328 [Lithocarpus litseifolius]|uniref:Uncharacterized protein n=1 Tax=Lithocarpus litseifolius TaxID=425828 RepID=A0AAW2CJB9_9ROSI
MSSWQLSEPAFCPFMITYILILFLSVSEEEVDDSEDEVEDSEDPHYKGTVVTFHCLRTEILEQELLLPISNAGGAPFLLKVRWKYPGMVVKVGCFVSYCSLCKGYGISKSGPLVQNGWPTSSSPSFGKDHNLEEGTRSSLQEMSFHKIEGEVVRSLVISKGMSPKRTPGDMGVVSNTFKSFWPNHEAWKKIPYWKITNLMTTDAKVLQEVLPFCGKLDGSILEWLLKPDVLFFTGRFARDMESAWVVIDRRLFTVQESQWREFKIDYNENVSSKFTAKNLRLTLSMKKHNWDVSTTPSWVVRLDDDEDEEDPEFYGAPAFESRLAPEGYKETTRHIQEEYKRISGSMFWKALSILLLRIKTDAYKS